MPRGYQLGRRQASVDRTSAAILEATRQLVAAGGPRPSAAAIARRAGVSRVTVYNRFGSVSGLLDRLHPDTRRRSDAMAPTAGARESLHAHLGATAASWAVNPALYRNLPRPPEPDAEAIRALVELLAAEDALRPGCSLKEAEDVIAVVSAFATFDRLHRDGRRPVAAVAEVLMRLASAALA